MQLDDHKRSPLVWFYRIGIGGENTMNFQGWNIKTLSSLFHLVGDTNVSLSLLFSKIGFHY